MADIDDSEEDNFIELEVDDETYARWENLASELNMSVEDLIRGALKTFVAKNNPLP